MPLKLNFRRTHRYNVSAKDLYVIPIYSLDNICVEYTVSPTTTGRDALEYVAQRLDIEDTCFFGFRYEAWTDDQRWLFLNKPVKKQLDKYARQHALVLNITLFIDNPQYLPDSRLRRQFYLQLRQDVLTGQLKLTSKQAIKLTAYSLQAEHGDFVDFETTVILWRERPMISESVLGSSVDLASLEHVDDIIWGYCQLRGVSQENAIWYYLDEIRRLSSYGVQLFYGSISNGDAGELGVSRNGVAISTLSNPSTPVSKLKWEDIKDLAYSRKTFTIQLLKKAKSILFLFEDTQEARYLWNFCIQMHNSYIHYWTHVKTGPLQPTMHVSEPPDILRGTALTLPTSSPVSDLHGTSRNVSRKASETPSNSSGIVATNSASNTTVGSATSSHAVTPTGSKSLRHINTNSQASNQSEPTEGTIPTVKSKQEPQQSALPRQSEQQQAMMMMMNGMMVGNGVGTESDGGAGAGGTLVGVQWSTMDSQIIANHCVSCLPVALCLRNSIGTNSGIGSNSANAKQSVVRPTNLMSAADNSTKVVDQVLTIPQEPKKRHHHHRKHRIHQQNQRKLSFEHSQPQQIGEKSTTSPQEVAARYNLSLAETSSGTSSESEFESDNEVCSMTGDSSSSQSSTASRMESVEPQAETQLQQSKVVLTPAGVFRRGVGGGTGGNTSSSLRPILAGFNQHHYRLQQNWRGVVGGDEDGVGVDAVEHEVKEGHGGWLANAKRLTNALSESLTRRALNATASQMQAQHNQLRPIGPFSSPQLLPHGTKSVGIAQVIRPEQNPVPLLSPQPTEVSAGQILTNQPGTRKPCRPPIPPQISCPKSQEGGAAQHHEASTGPSGVSSSHSFAPPSTLHRSLYEKESARPQIRLHPPSPPHQQDFWKSGSAPANTPVVENHRQETPKDSAAHSWHLVRHPIMVNQSNKDIPPCPSSFTGPYFTGDQATSESGATTGSFPPGLCSPDSFPSMSWEEERGKFEQLNVDLKGGVPLKFLQPGFQNQQIMSSSICSSSSTSSSSTTSSVAVIRPQVLLNSNSSSPSSPASSIGSSPPLRLLEAKECSSSSTMSYSESPAILQDFKNPQDIVLTSQAAEKSHRQSNRQRSLSGASGSGPLHLLTNSDIHQLLNLTKMRETALVHRLLAEYRQTLLLQQSLHANSVSTPNLAASQELRAATLSPLSSVDDGNAGGGRTVAVGDGGWQGSTTTTVCCGQQRAKRVTDDCRHATAGYGYNSNSYNDARFTTRFGIHRNQRQPSDSADYVNAAAFHCQRRPRHFTSVLSTTDNDSNATFRIVSEADARTSGYSNVKDSFHNHHSNHHHEDTCTNSDLLTSSLGAVPVSQPSKTPPIDQRRTPKIDLPDMIAGLPEERRGRSGDFSLSNSTQDQIGNVGLFTRSKTFAGTPPAGTPYYHVGFNSKALTSSSMGNSFHTEYENLETDSHPLSSANPPSTTDISVKSSGSESGSFEDCSASHCGFHLQSISKTPTILSPLAVTSNRFTRRRRRPSVNSKTEFASCVSHPYGNQSQKPATSNRRRFSEGGVQKRSTLPTGGSCDSGYFLPNQPVQLCRQHRQAFEQHLGGGADTPKVNKHRSATPLSRGVKQCCHCRCHGSAGEQRHQSPSYTPLQRHLNMPLQQHRYSEKARSYDPFLATPIKHASPHRTLRKQQQHTSSQRQQTPKADRSNRCSVSPGPGFVINQHKRHRHNHPSRRRKEREVEANGCDMCQKRKCYICDPSSDEPSSLSSSRAASDSSLTSIPTIVKDIMVSSYEYESQHADRSVGGASGLNRTASSFDSLVSGCRFKYGKNLSSRNGGKYLETAASHESMGKPSVQRLQKTPHQVVYSSDVIRKPPRRMHQSPPLPPSFGDQFYRRNVSSAKYQLGSNGTCCHHHHNQLHQPEHRVNFCEGCNDHVGVIKSKSKTITHIDCNRGSNDLGSFTPKKDVFFESPTNNGLLENLDTLIVARNGDGSNMLERPKTLSSSASFQVDTLFHQRPPLCSNSTSSSSKRNFDCEVAFSPLPQQPNNQIILADQTRGGGGSGVLFTASMTFTPSCGTSPNHVTSGENRQSTSNCSSPVCWPKKELRQSWGARNAFGSGAPGGNFQRSVNDYSSGASPRKLDHEKGQLSNKKVQTPTERSFANLMH